MSDDDRTGHRVVLPPGAQPPFTVYVNGEERQAGGDFELVAGHLVFATPLVVGKKAGGFWRKTVMFTAGVGFYSRGDVVDLHYRDAGGGPGVASGLPVLPD